MCGWAGWHVMSKISSNTLSPHATQFVFAICGIIATPLFYIMLPKHTKWDWHGIGWAAGAWTSTAIATFAYVSVLSKNNISGVVGIASSYPIIVMLLAVVFMGEAFSWSKFIGLLCVLLGVFVSSR